MASTSPDVVNPQIKRQKTAEPGVSINEYSGYVLPCQDAPIDRRVLDECFTPQMFFHEYIATRRPVVLVPSTQSNDWGINFKNWSYDYLREVVGSSKVRIERRENSLQKFGLGLHEMIPFSTFIDLMENQNQNVYLTTQDLDVDEDGMPELMGSPCKELYQHGDFPLRPNFLGKLIPMNMNLWWGCSSKLGSSSGLHHDYHDNIYCLIKGCKKFTLFSPKDTLNLSTFGNVMKVHKNGRINYEGVETYPDGSNYSARLAMNADDKLQIAEKKLEEGIFLGDDKLIQLAEEEIERALEAIVDAESQSEIDQDMSSDNNNEDEEGGEEEEAGDDDDDDDDERPDRDEGGVTDTPMSFSQINENLNDWTNINEKFPLTVSTMKTDVLIRQGEMLYLPCGWFHEVYSLPSQSTKKKKEEEEEEQIPSHDNKNRATTILEAHDTNEGNCGEHMAFNYWFHPPDTAAFEAPYSSPFWSQEFAKRNIILP